jgi:hypothetical protein
MPEQRTRRAEVNRSAQEMLKSASIAAVLKNEAVSGSVV